MSMKVVAKGVKEVVVGTQKGLETLKKAAEGLSPKEKTAMKEAIEAFSKKVNLSGDKLERLNIGSTVQETKQTTQKMSKELKSLTLKLDKLKSFNDELLEKFAMNKLTGKELVELLGKDVKGALDAGVLVIDGKLCSLATGKALNGLKTGGKAGNGIKILFNDGIPTKVLIEHNGKKMARTLARS